MKKALLFALLLAVPLLGRASHIVGGEFELLHFTGFRYRLNMVLYFDEVNGSEGARDQTVTVRVYRKRDNAVMGSFTLPRASITDVLYTQPACANASLKTSKLIYSSDITLSSATYSDPGGYYVSWERCCRNYGITNIYSEDTTIPGRRIYAGQTFYLEFPPVVKDGVPFVDSTPKLFPPLSDYACINKPYYADFGGVDDDGDSLVYSLTAPYNTITGDALPTPRPAPYPTVTFRPPFSMSNIMGGNPDLTISKDGLLRVTPRNQVGLFVFAVKVEEYRDKVKIGETRRDFQMLVIDCPQAVPPVIVGKKLTDVTYTYSKTMSVFFNTSVTDQDRCVNVQVSDEDSKSTAPRDNKREVIRLKAVAMNFNADLSSILPAVSTATLIDGSVAEFTICFPDCPYLIGADPIIGIVAMDDACSLPLMDTLKITVHVVPPANTKPRFVMPTITPVNAVVHEGAASDWPGEVREWDFRIEDDDRDLLVLTASSRGTTLAAAGMTLTTEQTTQGIINGKLKWDPLCNIYDFTTRTAFQITLAAEDADRCKLIDPARQVYNLNIILPPNAPPTIDTDLTPDPNERLVTGIVRRIDEPLKFRITSKDTDVGEPLLMTASGLGFTFADRAISVTPNPSTGLGTATADFLWNIVCKSVDLKIKDTFDFRFVVVNSNDKCRRYLADTVDVSMKVLPPLNAAPVLTMTNQNSPATTLTNDNGISVIRGSAIQLLLTGTDADVIPSKDNLKIDLVSKTGSVTPVGYSFSAATGTSPIQTTFTWQPDCSIFENGIYENDYQFVFRLTDDHCITGKKDSIIFKLKIKDIDGSDQEFIPPNFFSPNGDGFNDYFAMEKRDPETGALQNILPLDNCVSKFESIRIYDRWGNEVYQSNNRDFHWDGGGGLSGVYFYFLKYNRKTYRGSVSLTH